MDLGDIFRPIGTMFSPIILSKPEASEKQITMNDQEVAVCPEDHPPGGQEDSEHWSLVQMIWNIKLRRENQQ